MLAIALSAGSVAHADQLNGGKIAMKLKLPPEGGGTGFTDPTAQYVAHFFNGARCACDAGGKTQQYRIEYSWSTMPSPPASHVIDVWTGVGCGTAMDNARAGVCTHQPQITDPTALDHTLQLEYRVKDLVVDPDSPNLCPADMALTGEHWAVTQTGDSWDMTNRDHLVTTPPTGTGTTDGVTVDMQPPPLPGPITVDAIEGGIRLSWTSITTRRDDLHVFQALCSRADGSVAHRSPTSSRQYETPRTLCDASTDIALTKVTAANPIGDPGGDLPEALAQLDDSFICGQADGTVNGIDLSGLADKEPYWVVLLSVDQAGNAAGVYLDRPITPQAVIDFWEEINNEDPGVQGGFCVAQVGHDGALGSAALVGLAGLLAVRRRRRRGARAAKLIALALVLAPGVASAQNSFSPYWQEEDQADSGLPEPHWNIGLRLGPYTPSIDDKFDSDPGPYARTFKAQSLMFAVDLHRVWSVARGQLGVGGSAGYYTNSALAFRDETSPDDPNRPRATGNLIRLSIVPLELTAIYRATIFDDELGIPIVPYARGGLAYDVWWMRAPSGDLSTVMSCPTCANDKARGGSIGLVAAAGLAIRAERIDADAARSMQDTGLEHAGFFAEIEGSWVDGFGNDKRLSLGDLTWFGGIDFEF